MVADILFRGWGHDSLVVIVSDSGLRGRRLKSHRPGCVLVQDLYLRKAQSNIPRKQWLCPDMTEN